MKGPLFSIICTFIILITLCTVNSRNEKSKYLDHYYSLYGYPLNDTFTNDKLNDLTVGLKKFVLESQIFDYEEQPDITPMILDEFDFIVVGGGTAGVAIAARLTEIQDATVLLIEAGGSEHLSMDIPLLALNQELSDTTDWNYTAEPSTKYCLAMSNNSCKIVKGKGMGGSNIQDHMTATRGHSKDYDKWAKMGNHGWSYQDVLPYFKKVEKMEIPTLQNDTSYHNTKGPLNIQHIPFRTPLAESFIDAGIEMGYPTIDYNGLHRVGFSLTQSTTKNGERVTTNRAYLHSLQTSTNLVVTKHSTVSKILIDPKTRQAFGVEFVKGGDKFYVQALKEIIVSAGNIGSPQLLMLSGIGPADHLNEIGIDLVQDAPVGKNFMNHIAYDGLIFLVDQPVGISFADVENAAYPYISDYLIRRQGPFTVPAGREALAFIDVDQEYDANSYPNIELLFYGVNYASNKTTYSDIIVTNKYRDKILAPITDYYVWSVKPICMKPKSRGRILLSDNDYTSKPRIIPNYMDNPEDLKMLVKGIKAAIRLSQTKAMQRYGSKLYDFVIPGCEKFVYKSDDYWECATRYFTASIHDDCGTCKMGPEGDPTAVVNPRLQVIGVKRLRVADSSIIPEIITGHLTIPTLMIAEKLVDMVKEDWEYDKVITKK